MVSVDLYLNETTRHADVILPPPSPLERSEYDLAFYGLAVRNFADWSPPLFEPDGPTEHEILARLALIASGPGRRRRPGGRRRPDVRRRAAAGHRRRAGLAASPTATVDELARRARRAQRRRPASSTPCSAPAPTATGSAPSPTGCRWPSSQANPHGIDLGAAAAPPPRRAARPPSGTVELAARRRSSPTSPGSRPSLDACTGNGDLVLVGRRHLRSNNSWMHNVDVLVKGKDRCTLQVHPDDADRLGLADGGQAEVASRVGKLVAPVEVTDAIRPGVVSLPHGWGHDLPGAQMGVAGRARRA